jgi:hypothetical protein
MKKYIYIAIAALAFASCNNDDDEGGLATANFTGTFSQEDQMGRPGINTVFTPTNADENAFNVTVPQNMISQWQPTFQSRVEGLYAAYSNTAGVTLNYETNILGLDLPTLTTALALDVLQVAPQGPTTYVDPSTLSGTSPIVLTGRNLTDDVIDVSLILLFGGNDGMRFPSMPNLISDNVGPSGSTTASFPYLGSARF